MKYLPVVLFIALLPILQAQEETSQRRFDGITAPVQDATLSASVAGVIFRQHFGEGDWVAEGEVIVELDNAEEKLEELRRSIILENLKRTLERTEELYKRTQAVSVEELETRRSEVRIAEAELQIARERVRKRKIAAPFAGYVTDLFDLRAGEGSEAQAPLARVIDNSQCNFEAHVDPAIGQKMEKGQSITIEIKIDGTPTQIEAIVTFVSPIVDSASGLIEVKAVFANPDAKVRPGVSGQLIAASS